MSNRGKKYDGPIKNTERTKQKLLSAVGYIIKEKGFTGLKINDIVDRAQVDRKTLYNCFGNLNNLVETYINGKDYYMGYHDQAEKLAKRYDKDNLNVLIKKLLLGQLDRFSEDEELQQILLWHLSEDNPLLSAINEERERIGSIFMGHCAPKFDGTAVDIRSRIALLIGGIYFIVLYSRTTKGKFCEIDFGTEQGKERLRDCISQFIEDTFDRVR